MELQRLKKQQSLSPDNPYWRNFFQRLDTDGNGKVSYKELKRKLKETRARAVLKRADTNEDGYIDYDEFIAVLEINEVRSLFKAVDIYINTVVPHKKQTSVDGDYTDAVYEDNYSCCPPPLGMVVLSLLEVIAFVYDAAINDHLPFSEVTAALIYDPHRRAEAWRFLTYMFVHNGVFHLIINLVVQIMLGIPLEMVHQWWRVIIIYLAGVVAGSLGTSISDPSVYLAGASGGVYAIMTAHVATIILNWSDMKLAFLQLAIFLLIACVDVGTAIYNRYYLDSVESHAIGYAAHLAGAIAGLLVGINVLRNFEVKSWEKMLWWVAIVVYSLLMLIAIVWNAAYPSYFPPQTTS